MASINLAIAGQRLMAAGSKSLPNRRRSPSSKGSTNGTIATGLLVPFLKIGMTIKNRFGLQRLLWHNQQNME
jgi:hypothetical protein